MRINLFNQHPLPPAVFDEPTSDDVHAPSDGRIPPIFCASPFIGRPFAMDSQVEVWLDVNILSHAKYDGINPNIVAMIEWIKVNRYGISPNAAYLEHHRTNNIFNAWDIALNTTLALQNKYGIVIDPTQLSLTMFQIPEILKDNHDYVNRLACYVVIIRHLFSLNSSFNARCKMLAQIIGRTLPRYSFMYYLACLYFYAKDHNKEFCAAYPDKKIFGKIQKDMKMERTSAARWQSAINVASDISIFTATLLQPVSPETGLLRVTYIATSDKTLILMLKELCYFAFDLKNGTGFGLPTYRPNGVGDLYIAQTVEKNMRSFMPSEPFPSNEESDCQLKSLKKIALDILDEKFDVKAYLRERGFR